MPSELRWLVGPGSAAVRRRESRIFSLWPRPSELGRVPMGLHMALARPNDELYADPTATRSVVVAELPAFKISLPIGGLIVLLLGALAASGLNLGEDGFVGLPAAYIRNGQDLAFVFVAAALGYGGAALWEAGLCVGQLRPPGGCFGLGAKGPSVEPVVWRLGLPVATAWLAVLGPLALAAAAIVWSTPWPAFGSGLALGAALYLLRVTLPIRPGPGTRILESVLRVSDFTTALRWGLTTQFLPANQRSATGRPGLLFVAALALIGWMVVVGVSLPVLISPQGLGIYSGAEVTEVTASPETVEDAEDEPDEAALPAGLIEDARFAGTVWQVVISLIGVAVILWLVESLVRLFRYALLFGGRVEREPVSPSPAARAFWARESALTRHVPAMAKLAWQWSRASAGTLLVRQGDRDRSFHWLASGEARVVARDAQGNVRQLAVLRGGSGVGEVALLENQPRNADVVVSRTALVVSLAFEDFDREITDRDRERFREVVLAGRSFARSAVFKGCPAPDKERWIRGGGPRRFRPGESILREGDRDRWMGLIVDGEVEVVQGGQVVAVLESSSVFGEVAFLYETARNASLVAKDEVLIWAWEPDWLSDEVEKTGLRPDLEALASRRSGG